jgi:multidrug resistance efflux pump
MNAVKQCEAQAAEYHRLMQSAQSETEARLLKSISQSWVRVANQISRYQSLVSRDGARADRSTFQSYANP